MNHANMVHARGFTLIELLIVVAIIGILAAIAIPGLIYARMSGNEASAIGSLRAINSGQSTYASSCAGGGYAVALADLAKPAPAAIQGFISPDLATDPSMKSGYSVSLAAEASASVTTIAAAASTCNSSGNNAQSSYWAGAVPVSVGSTGQRSFATDSRGTIYFLNTGVAIADPIPAGTPVLQ